MTSDELARLRLRAKHGGTLTPEEQRAYDDYVTEQLSAVSSPPSGAVPPKKGFKWESEKVAEWRLKARHDGLDENERLLYQDYQQTLALAGASVEAENKAYSPKAEKSIVFRGAVSLALLALIGLFSISGCKLSELSLLVPYTSYQLGYALTGEMPNTNEALTPIAVEGLDSRLCDIRTYANYIQSEEANTPFDDITSSFHHFLVKDSVRDDLLSENVVGGFADAIQNDAAFRDAVYRNSEVYQAAKKRAEEQGKTIEEQANGGKQTIEDLGNG
ncbi:hypothetical protein [Bifidobacterium breve]|uniref:hypothetical protein n=1 Tax=Bifidobacterium breve TaxID=1685 RepID=UPI00254B5C55|nr:hypothetical protein [Bifidobacterium breve]MDK7091314.1 hypothetical protein [Bifidobacterium breve]